MGRLTMERLNKITKSCFVRLLKNSLSERERAMHGCLIKDFSELIELREAIPRILIQSEVDLPVDSSSPHTASVSSSPLSNN